MSWFCVCGLLNSGLNEDCAAKQSRDSEHYQVSRNSLDELRLKFEDTKLTPNEELFVKFYNPHKIYVSEMDDTALREHRESLSQIVIKGKACLIAADDEIRERSAKRRTKDKEWIVPVDAESRASDAISAVKERGKRITKIEKLQQQLLAAGIDDETVKETIANIERKATNKQMKTITFNRPTTEVAAIQVKEKTDEKAEPFDLSTLGFK